MKSPDSDKQNLEIGKDLSIEPLNLKQRQSFFEQVYGAIDPVTASAVGAQVTTNVFSRQVLANFRMGVNTGGENITDVAKRLGGSASTLFRGVPSRFMLQFATQGMSTILNRSASRGVENPITLSPSFTAVSMTALGMFAEPYNLRGAIGDKVQATEGRTINFRSRLPVMTPCVFPFMMARNEVYSISVFGNKDKPLGERMIIAGVAGMFSNIFDNGVNVAAYEAAVAKDGTPLSTIFSNIYRSFVGNAEQAPYEKLVNGFKRSLNGVSLRVAGVAGACFILSDEVTKKLEENFEEYSQNIGDFWQKFWNDVEKRGGVESSSENIKKDPSTSPSVCDHNISSLKQPSSQQEK